jgi:transcriptional regulator with GAF, ATPase, and Fis domain
LAEKCGEGPASDDGARVSSTEGLLAEVLQQASPRLLPDAASEAHLEELLKVTGNFRIQTWMAAPLKRDEEVLGVVELFNKQDCTTDVGLVNFYNIVQCEQ